MKFLIMNTNSSVGASWCHFTLYSTISALVLDVLPFVQVFGIEDLSFSQLDYHFL